MLYAAQMLRLIANFIADQISPEEFLLALTTEVQNISDHYGIVTSNRRSN